MTAPDVPSQEDWPVPSKEPSQNVSFLGITDDELPNVVFDIYDVRDIAYYCTKVPRVEALCRNPLFWVALDLGDKDTNFAAKHKLTITGYDALDLGQSKQMYRARDTWAYLNEIFTGPRYEDTRPLLATVALYGIKPTGREVHIDARQVGVSRVSPPERHMLPWVLPSMTIHWGSPMVVEGDEWDAFALYFTGLMHWRYDLPSGIVPGNAPRISILNKNDTDTFERDLEDPGLLRWRLSTEPRTSQGAPKFDLALESGKDVSPAPGKESYSVDLKGIQFTEWFDETNDSAVVSEVKRVATTAYQNYGLHERNRAKFPTVDDPNEEPNYALVREQRIALRKLAWNLLTTSK